MRLLVCAAGCGVNVSLSGLAGLPTALCDGVLDGGKCRCRTAAGASGPHGPAPASRLVCIGAAVWDRVAAVGGLLAGMMPLTAL